MRYTNVLIRSHKELLITNPQCRHTLVSEARSNEKGSYPIVYQYMGTRNTYRMENTIPDEVVIGKMTNIRQDDISGDIVCDVNIYDVKQHSVNFDFKIDNFVINISDGKESIVNGIIYNKYAKSVIDAKKRASESKFVRKMEPSPVPDDIANDKVSNPLFNPDIQKSIHDSMKGGDFDDKL